jgi:hypothetical protein
MGGDGGPGYLKVYFPISDFGLGVRAQLPPTQIIRASSGVGVAVPADFLGLHLGSIPYGRTVNVTTSGGNLTGFSLDPLSAFTVTFKTAAPAPLTTQTVYVIKAVAPIATPPNSQSVYAVYDVSGTTQISVSGTGSYGAQLADAPPTVPLHYGDFRTQQTDLRWAEVQPNGAPGQGSSYPPTGPNLDQFDAFVSYHAMLGHTITWVIGSTPAWAVTGGSGLNDAWGIPNGAQQPTVLADLDYYVRFIVDRYNGTNSTIKIANGYAIERPIRIIEPLNEPKLDTSDLSGGFYRGTLSQAVDYVRTVNKAAKAIDKNVKIAGLAWSTGSLPWPILDHRYGQVVAYLETPDASNPGKMGKDWIDILSVHPYNVFASVGQDSRANVYSYTSTILRLQNDLRKVLKMGGVSNYATFPLMNSEWGIEQAPFRFVWNATALPGGGCSEGMSGKVLESGQPQVGDGDEVLAGAVSTSGTLGLLHEAVHRLDESVAAVIEHAAHDGAEFVLDRGGELLERL